MIHPNTSNELAKNISEMAHDIWKSRNHLNLPMYFCFRVSISEFTEEEDNTEEFYVHYVIESKQWWYYTISDFNYFEINHSDLIFENEENTICSETGNTIYRGKSYRHYAFIDCMERDILKKYNEVAEGYFDNVSQITIWNMFPVCDFYV